MLVLSSLPLSAHILVDSNEECPTHREAWHVAGLLDGDSFGLAVIDISSLAPNHQSKRSPPSTILSADYLALQGNTTDVDIW